MRRYVKYAINNNCFKAATEMTPVGILVHSTGAINKSLKRYVNFPAVCGENPNKNYWDQPKPEGKDICVHAFLGEAMNGTVATVEILPHNYACWGCGKGVNGSYNYNPNGHIQFEICEGSSIDKAYFDEVWRETVDYCTWLCKEYNWKNSSVITSHKEAALKGFASAHSDPFDYFAKFSKSMDMLRAEVQSRLIPAPSPVNTSTLPYAKGRRLVLKNVALYPSAYVKTPVRYLNGVYYSYDGTAINGFIRICPSINHVGKPPVGSNVTGFIKISDI